MLGKPVSSVQKFGEEETASGTQSGLTQEEIAEQELQQLMAQEPEGTCATEKPGEPAKDSEIPESMKIGPLIIFQRSRYLLHQMQRGLRQWFASNWPKLLLTAVGALLGFIALNIITGGAIFAALPLIMQIVSAVMAGVALGRVIDYVGKYLSDGWVGDIVNAATSLARGLAVGAIELIFALIFNLGTVIKTLKTGLTASLKTAAKAVKIMITTTIKNVKELGRIGLQAGKAMIKNGKLLFKGLKTGFSKGAKSLDDLAKGLWERVRFKKFVLRMAGEWIELWGYINPPILISKIKAKFKGVDDAAATDIAATLSTKRKFLYKVTGVFERITTSATEAKKVVESVVGKLKRKYPGTYGIPDNILITSKGLINEVEEVKYFGRETIENLGKLAEENPQIFIEEGLGKGKYIQIMKHMEIISEIASDPTLVQGTVITGVSKNVKYVVTFPKMVGKDLKAVEEVIPKLKRAWKQILGIDVTVKFGSHSTQEVQKAVKNVSEG